MPRCAATLAAPGSSRCVCALRGARARLAHEVAHLDLAGCRAAGVELLEHRGDRIVLEECLVGPEASYFVLADGQNFMPLSSAQDHKRIFDDDRGPNTGGMGAFAPTPLLTPALERRVIDEIVRPVLDGMRDEGITPEQLAAQVAALWQHWSRPAH